MMACVVNLVAEGVIMVWQGLIGRCMVGLMVLVVVPFVATAAVMYCMLTTAWWVFFEGDITHATFDCGDDELE